MTEVLRHGSFLSRKLFVAEVLLQKSGGTGVLRHWSSLLLKFCYERCLWRKLSDMGALCRGNSIMEIVCYGSSAIRSRKFVSRSGCIFVEVRISVKVFLCLSEGLPRWRANVTRVELIELYKCLNVSILSHRLNGIERCRPAVSDFCGPCQLLHYRSLCVMLTYVFVWFTSPARSLHTEPAEGIRHALLFPALGPCQSACCRLY